MQWKTTSAKANDRKKWLFLCQVKKLNYFLRVSISNRGSARDQTGQPKEGKRGRATCFGSHKLGAGWDWAAEQGHLWTKIATFAFPVWLFQGGYRKMSFFTYSFLAVCNCLLAEDCCSHRAAGLWEHILILFRQKSGRLVWILAIVSLSSSEVKGGALAGTAP